MLQVIVWHEIDDKPLYEYHFTGAHVHCNTWMNYSKKSIVLLIKIINIMLALKMKRLFNYENRCEEFHTELKKIYNKLDNIGLTYWTPDRR